MLLRHFLLVLATALVSAKPINVYRQVDELDEEAFNEAQQRDDTATRAFSDVKIKTSDGKCLYVDPLSGDFRANLTPVQIADCGSTDGQGWDIITSGKHHSNDKGRVLIVSTLTQACFNADPRRRSGDQVVLFSCGGRADGGGEVTDSQLFLTDGQPDEFRLSPQNGGGFCLISNGQAIDIAECDENAADQKFTVGGSGGDQPTSSPTTSSGSPATSCSAEDAACTDGGQAAPDSPASTTLKITAPPATASTANPTSPVPVSRAGGTLNPESAAEAQQFDDTAERALSNINVRSSDNKCLSVDPTAGDFRKNLIPVQLVPCADEPNQKFDIVTKGKHNDGASGRALIVSSLTQGCLSFDARRPDGDTVTIFSCGGRAAGEGETDRAQLYPFDGSKDIVLQPESGDDGICLVAGGERLDSATCPGDEAQTFELVEL